MTSLDTNRLIPTAAYVHIPFCVSKCLYCDFNSYPERQDIFDSYIQAVVQDIKQSPDGPELETVFFGGGTPTVLSAGSLSTVLGALAEKYGLAEDCEVTSEANPGTIDLDYARALREVGFNRISLGAQSFNDHYLRLLGRIHTSEQIFTAVDACRGAGFDSLSLDLMYGIPAQKPSEWQSDLLQAISTGVQHISAYELTIEEYTPLAQSVADGTLVMPDEELQIELNQMTQELLSGAGYLRYEVSNYAKPGYECRHNLKYWHNEAYWGFGAGAIEYVAGRRSARMDSPELYIDAVMHGRSPIDSSEVITGRMLEAETMMMGLRLTEGMSIACIYEMSPETRGIVEKLLDERLLELKAGKISASPAGYLCLNDLAERFIP